MDEITNKELLNIVAAARQLGFDYHEDGSGRLVCTLEQLIAFSAAIATATVEQLIGVK